jgi:hypothetical protein
MWYAAGMRDMKNTYSILDGILKARYYLKEFAFHNCRMLI